MNHLPPHPLHDDPSLKRALQALPAAAAGAELDALGQRVLYDWHARQASGDAVQAATAPGATLGARLWQRRVWVGSAGLAAVAVVATAVLVTRPDPVLDELMQPDVLSEMAIGEM